MRSAGDMSGTLGEVRQRRDGSIEQRAADRRTYTVPYAAMLMGVSRAYLYRLIAEGRCPVPVLRIGARVVIPRAALDRYLDGHGGRHDGGDAA